MQNLNNIRYYYKVQVLLIITSIMKYVKSNRIATLRFECKIATILATKKKRRKNSTRGVSLKKTKAMNKNYFKTLYTYYL